MLRIKDILREIEQLAPLATQESFDNAGVQVGDVNQPATGALLCLDITEAVIEEAIELGYNLVLAHHPLIFKPFKSLTGADYIERCVIQACKHDLVIYAAHTNLDNAVGGVNYKLAELLGLQNVRILSSQKENVLNLENSNKHVGSGIVGELLSDEYEQFFLQRIKDILKTDCIRHSPLTGKKVREIAICGGSGAFMLPEAIAYGADVFITGEAKYNDFYNVEDKILLVAAGHYETEICTKDIFFDILSEKFPTFAVQIASTNSNPVKYL
jgi:dinuclear metal center YbgI/SA1388 family protein